MPADQSTLRPRYVDALAIGLILTALFALNARWGEEANIDAIAAGAPAWQLSNNATLDLSDYVGANPWFVEDSQGRVVSDRPPGLIAAAVPSYFVWRVEMFINGPGTLVALLATLAAMIGVWFLCIPHLGRSGANTAALFLALGTTTWSISSAQLWPHGLGQLAAVLTLGGFATSKYSHAGAASAFAITVRPITAVYAGVIGLAESWRLKSYRIALRYGSLTTIGLIVVLVYNRWLFGVWTLRGGQGTFTGGYGSGLTLGSYLGNLWTMFFGLRHGFLILSPIVLVGVVGAFVYRSRIPGWAKTAAGGAFVYLLVHAALNRASGGAVMFYRYPLEPIALASIALAIGVKGIFDSSRTGRFIVWATAGFSIGLQFVNVFIMSCTRGSPSTPACLLF